MQRKVVLLLDLGKSEPSHLMTRFWHWKARDAATSSSVSPGWALKQAVSTAYAASSPRGASADRAMDAGDSVTAYACRFQHRLRITVFSPH